MYINVSSMMGGVTHYMYTRDELPGNAYIMGCVETGYMCNNVGIEM